MNPIEATRIRVALRVERQATTDALALLHEGKRSPESVRQVIEQARKVTDTFVDLAAVQ